MDNTANKDFLERILNIDLNRYLKHLGFHSNVMSEDITAHSASWFPYMFIVNSRNNTYLTSRDLNDFIGKNVIELGLEIFKCTVPELLDKFKAYPDLPEKKITSKLDKLPHVPLVMLTETRPIQTEAATLYFSEVQLPLEFVRRHCKEFQARFGDDPREFTAIVLNTQKSYNQMIMIEDNFPHLTDEVTFISWEAAKKEGHHFIDKHSQSVEVFTRVVDLLTRRFQHEKLGLESPNQLLLTSTSAFEGARQLMERHSSINLYLPNTAEENIYKGYANWLSPKYKDFSPSYAKYEGVADRHIEDVKNGQSNKKKPPGHKL